MKLKTLIFSLLTLFAGIDVFAYDCEIDGIYYDFSGKVAIVTSGNNSYSGDIIIPASVEYNNTQYTVAEIGSYAFYNCGELNSVVIPNSVTSIGEGAFSECAGLTSIDIPEGVTSIGVEAFSGCSGLTSLVIPSSVTSISEVAFAQCRGLTSIAVASGNPVYDSRENCNAIIHTEDNTLILGCQNTIIPESVTNIGYQVQGMGPACAGPFDYCFGLTSITIPNSVKSIGDYAFGGCINLTSVIIGNNVTSIGRGAFSGCIALTSVTIPEGVTSIGHDAFDNCSALTEVTIPEGVTSIGDFTFSDCSNLTSITIPSSVTSIGDYAFKNCSALTSVTIPYGVTSIGDNAFSGCTGLASVTIPESVTSIGVEAFSGCSALTSVTIPKSVTSIGDEAFSGCFGLTSVKVNLQSPLSIHSRTFFNSTAAKLFVPIGCKDIYMAAEYWNDFNAIEETEFYIYFFNGEIGDICLANWDRNGDGQFSFDEAAAVTDLGEVFKENTEITNFDELGYFTGLTGISDNAFSGCRNMTFITIPESVTSIGQSAFAGCGALTSVTIPYGVTSIDASAFQGCEELTSLFIPSNVVSIGESAFGFCSSMTSVSIPSSVASIGDRAFWGCWQLTSVVVDGDNTVYDSRENCNAIIETSTNTLIAGCQNTIIPSSVTSIGDYAFDSCYSLSSVTIPSSVTHIGDGAFVWCLGLNSVKVDISSPIAISSSTFSNRANATLIVPAGCKTTYQAADYWKEFKDIVEMVPPTSPTITFADANVKAICVANWDTNGDGELSESEAAAVTDLGEVFKGNAEITSFDELQYFTGLAAIDENAFFGCRNLTAITIPESVTSIEEQAFSMCRELTSITIPNSVTYIGPDAFYDCDCLTTTIPNSVEIIGYRAFNGCSALTSITIPSSVTSIGSYAFSRCSGLTSISVQGGNGRYDSRENCNAIIVTGTNTLIAGCQNTIIPSNVTAIERDAFSGCIGLTTITIPNSVTSIGEYAFNNCKGLTSITIPSSVTTIGKAAFAGCSGLTSIHVESGNGTYDSRENCNAIIETGTNTLITGCQNTVIPSSVTTIGGYAFTDCSGLTSITIPNSVNLIGDWAFFGCDGLTSITIPNSVTSIGEYAFKGCDGLTSIAIPNSVTSIGGSAFSGCYKLSTVTIPNSVTTIGNYAFSNCRLTSVKIDIASPLSISSSTFSKRANATLIVPVGSKSAYLAADYWNDFKRIVEDIYGDVNADEDVDVVDVVDIARYVVGTPAETFVPILADIDNSGEVNIGDAVALVNEIAGDQNFVKAMRSPRWAETTDEALRLMAAGNGLSLILENQRDYTAFQFDLFVPEGTDVAQMLLNAQRKQKHQLLYNKVEEGHYRVAALSTSNHTFQGNDGELLSFVVGGGGDVSIRDIHFFTPDGSDYRFEALYMNYGAETGISSIENEIVNGKSIYDLNGRKMVNGKLPKGIYIVNGKKVFIK